MRKFIGFLVFSALAFLIVLAAPEEAAHAAKKGNCKITVTQTVRTGRAKKRIYYTLAESEARCAAKAKHHDHNFYPTEVKKKQVTFKFSESH